MVNLLGFYLPGTHEYVLEGAFTGAVLAAGAHDLGYPCIVGAGALVSYGNVNALVCSCTAVALSPVVVFPLARMTLGTHALWAQVRSRPVVVSMLCPWLCLCTSVSSSTFHCCVPEQCLHISRMH